MSMKFFLITALLTTLVVSGGIYAYTFTTGVETIGITEPAGNAVTVNATATQPNWDSVLNTVTDTLIFRPNAVGDDEAIQEQFPVTGSHWDKVDEAISDNDTTYIQDDSTPYREDLYNIPDHSTQTAGGDINYVTEYIVAKALASATQVSAYTHIKTNAVEYNGTSENLTTSYATYSYQWSNNPQTSVPWTWSEFDALQIGIGMREAAAGQYSRSTQIYSEISFDAPLLTGGTPTGDLFEITPDSGFSGDLQVRVYLMNTADVDKAYQSLEMQFYLESSVEAGESPNYQTLTIENGVATFNLVGISGGSFTLSVTGGSYTLTSREISEWAAGYTVIPELYCEVIQR